jgi:hypothetical protein
MALNTPSIIDIAALVAPPVIRTRHVVFASYTLRPLRSLLRIRFRVIASFTAISEVKVQKIAFATVPLIMFAVVVAVFTLTASAPIPGPRSGSFLLQALLMGFLVSINHRRLQITQLGFDDPRNSLNDVDLGSLGCLAGLGKIVLGLNGGLNRLPRGSIRFMVGGWWCHRAIMTWWITHRLDDHMIFRF